MTTNRITEDSIYKLINTFYTKVRSDKDLGPIFSNAIGNDDKEWVYHLQKMYDFWSSVMLSSRRYHGNPFEKHLMLPHFDLELFSRWLAIFEETVREIHTGIVVDQYIEKSRRIAKSLKLGLSSMRDNQIVSN